MMKVQFDLDGVKIPKKVGGVKVPKKLRKQGKRLIAKANSPQGREVIAAGLAIAGSAIAAKAAAKAGREGAGREGFEVPPRPPKPPKPMRPGEPGIGPGTAPFGDPAHELGDAIAAGIGALQRFLAKR